jgi:hypothetical protein
MGDVAPLLEERGWGEVYVSFILQIFLFENLYKAGPLKQ